MKIKEVITLLAILDYFLPGVHGQFMKPDAILNPEKVEFCSKAVDELEKTKDVLQKRTCTSSSQF